MIKTTPQFEAALRQLNPAQQQAVTTFDGPVLVVAGPGTGKTQVLTMRIAYILQNEEIKAGNILALTFTESGVAAMKQRLIQLIGPTGYYVHIQTFHSFCNNVILEFPDKFSYRTRDFTNLTDLERFKIIREILDTLPLKHLRSFRETYFYIRAILSCLQTLKKEGLSPADFKKIVDVYADNVKGDKTLLNKDGTEGERYRKEWKKVLKNQELVLVYEQYQKKLESMGRYDYEDMIMFVVQKLKDDEELLRTIQERYQHFLIDEYQDTNGAQNFVVYQLANFFDNPNLFVVGDDDQSIYRFQGASLENMLYLNDKFKNITTVVLDTNYRSTQTIIDASTSVIVNNTDRITNPIYGFQVDKTFQAAKKTKGEKIQVYDFSSGEIENLFLVREIEKLMKQEVPAENIAVIYRNNQDALDLMNTFKRGNIPYVLEGGFDVLQDNHIARIIELLQVINDPTDGTTLFRVLHHEAFGLKALDLMKLSRAAYNHRKGDKTMIDLALDLKKLKENELEEPEKLTLLSQTLLELNKDSQNTVLLDLVEKALRVTGILDHYLNQNNLITINRINSFFNFIKQQNYRNHRLKLADFLQDIEVMLNENISLPENKIEVLEHGVHLMTAHKSKGLEFEYVFIVKCIDGRWGNPQKREVLELPPNILQEQALNKIEPNEDERRLFYVALTRAKEKIYITHAKRYPLLDKNNTIPSQFIGEIDPQFVQQENASVYEQQASEALALALEPAEKDTNQDTEKFLNGLVQTYRINAVALNSYLECPRKFQYDHLVKVPQVKSKLQQFGTAVHTALELFFNDLKTTGKVESKEKLLQYYEEALSKELSSELDFKESLLEGKNVLGLYYDFYHEKFTAPLYLERDYNRIPLYFDDIPLSGKIDKIEPIEDLKGSQTFKVGQVRIVDYKTGRPKSENEIKGLTLTSKGKKGYFYQLLFYKLLVELDQELNLRPVSGVLDFVFPEKDGANFRQVEIEYSSEEFEEFKKVLKEVYQKIQKLEFPKTTDLKTCENCPYRKICWKETLF